ncbi:sporulation protein [Thiomonas sp. FB-Cd]|uniref:sporulation protein n=1 Tax=Thiomonas sp. FB-Cd TaxID=1158292 RepID=UPI0012DD470C|nr:sporulation protein [Thiomonas sp. FB-Cd]
MLASTDPPPAAMLRTIVLLLILANLGFFAWSHGYLRAAGLGPTTVGEPQRLRQQIHPERLTIAARTVMPDATPASAPERRASTASIPAAAVSEANPAPPPVGSAPAAAASGAETVKNPVCLQLGPYLTASSAVGAALRAAGFAPVEKQRPLPPQWMVLMGPYPDTDTLKRKLGELQRLGLKDGSYAAVPDRPRYMPGISLGVLSTEAAAQAQLANMQAKGVSSAHVVQRNLDMQATTWVLDGLTEEQAANLHKLGAAALKGKAPEACPGR